MTKKFYTKEEVDNFTCEPPHFKTKEIVGDRFEKLVCLKYAGNNLVSLLLITT